MTKLNENPERGVSLSWQRLPFETRQTFTEAPRKRRHPFHPLPSKTLSFTLPNDLSLSLQIPLTQLSQFPKKKTPLLFS